jgi:hypothetical protein
MYVFTSSLTFGRRLAAKFASCVALTFAADFLFYDQHLGWTLGLFALGLLLAIMLHQPHLQKSTPGKLLALAAGGLALAMIEEPMSLTVGLYLLTVFGLVLLPKMDSRDARHVLRIVLRYFLITGGWRIYQDSILLAYVRKRLRKLNGRPYGWVLRWALPVLCSLGFAALFAQANPVLTRLLEQIDFKLPEVSFWRVAFWVAIPSFCWALLRPKLSLKTMKRSPWERPAKQRFTLMGLLFNDQAIATSLVLFNVLFLAQNAMDVLFIWSGSALPEGMTYAEYAHRGAYPLMITALLAAFFILVAFKAETTSSKRVQVLVYAWVAQNIFLVSSSIARLVGYIAEYQLTYLRVAALIWMVLVAAGLLLILARIRFKHSNRWLVNRNAVMLYATLYLCCFINFGGMIASYNLTKPQEGRMPDLVYLSNSVGVAALPALIEEESSVSEYANYCRIREKLQSELHTEDWRAWTFRRHRIAQIAAQPCGQPQPTDQKSFLSPGYSLRK